MTRRTDRWRGVLAGLALLAALPALADRSLRQVAREQLRNENYVLVEDLDSARLLIFSSGSVSAVANRKPAEGSRREWGEALEMTRSEDSRTRVRGLTLLSGFDDTAALDAALVLLSDPVAAVREEAVQLVMEHPDADVDSIIAIASRDPSSRVREASADLTSEHSDERED